MLIKSLKMQNFRQFKGKTEVNFSCDSKRNVTIILGDNTYGKTTLLQAFIWCFYGKAYFNQDPDFLLNLEVAEELRENEKADVMVEIVVIQDNTEFTITRVQKYIKQLGRVKGDKYFEAKVSYKQKDGQTEPIRGKQVPSVINNILPEELSSYFFFDTERVSNISNRKDVAEAVKGLLGLSALENAVKHLGDKTKKTTTIGKIYESLDVEGDEKAERILNQIHENEEKETQTRDQLDKCNEQIAHYEARKEFVEEQLKANETTSELQKRKEKLEKDIKIDEESLVSAGEECFADFNSGALAFFSQPLLKKALDFLKEAKVDDKGVQDLTKPTIMELLKRGRCICGQEIKEGNEAYRHLMEELSYVPPESVGNTVRHYREKLNSFAKPGERTFESIEQRYKEMLRTMQRIQDYKDDIEDISEKIQGKENMARYEDELRDIKTALKSINEKRDRLNNDIGRIQAESAGLQKEYDKLTANSDRNKQALEYLAYAETIKNWLIVTYRDKELEIRESLQEKVNEIFKKMYHGKRKVVIDDKYHVELLSTVADREIASGESEGSNRVKNFAFIAGLVSLAKNRIVLSKAKEGIELGAEPYPLVMDAPFSNADETHTTNISKVLPEVAEQVIMFVMQKDWNYAERVMNDRVGCRYRLEKESETCTYLRQ